MRCGWFTTSVPVVLNSFAAGRLAARACNGVPGPHTLTYNQGSSVKLERFTQVQGTTLKIYYNLSTFNPYTVVKMESDFTITRGSQ